MDTDYQAVLDVAGRIAVMSLDDQGGPGIDDATREKAREFLRSEFETWKNGPPETQDEEQDGPES